MVVMNFTESRTWSQVKDCIYYLGEEGGADVNAVSLVGATNFTLSGLILPFAGWENTSSHCSRSQ